MISQIAKYLPWISRKTVTLPALQTAFDAGTTPQKAAFQSSVSGGRVNQAEIRTDGRSALLCGNSMVAGDNGPGPTGTNYGNGGLSFGWEGWFTWCNIALGQPFTEVWNIGKGFDTSADIIARFDADYAAGGAGKIYDYGFLLCEINDFIRLHNTTAAPTIANVQTLWGKMKAVCRRVVIIPALPNLSTTTAEKSALSAVLAWERLNAKANGVYICDIGTAVVDPSHAAPWAIRADCTPDNTHLNQFGAQRTGMRLAKFLQAMDRSFAGVPFAGADGNNLLANSNLGGATSPTGWSEFNTITARTRTARPDGDAGNVYNVTTSDTLVLVQNLNHNAGQFARGRICVMEAEFLGFAGAVGAQFNLQVNVIGGVTTNIRAMTGAYPWTATPIPGVYRTPPFMIPSDCNTLQAFVLGSAAGTYSFARPCLRYVA